MYFVAFSDGFEGLMVHGRDKFMLVDARSPEQQMIRGTRIDRMETSGCSHRSNSRIETDVGKSEGRVAPKPDTSNGCSMILLRLPIASSFDNG